MPKTKAKSLMRLTSYILSIDPDMTVTRFHVFLIAATGKDVLVRDIVKRTGLNQSTIARTLALLSDKPMRGQKEGLGLLSMKPDPDDPRRVLINVTPKGEKVLADVADMT